MKKRILSVLIIIISVILLVSLFCFFNGSLEMHPTEEQNEKTKIASSIIGGICIIIDVILKRLRTKHG